jgi:hypothetical protein
LRLRQSGGGRVLRRMSARSKPRRHSSGVPQRDMSFPMDPSDTIKTTIKTFIETMTAR